MFFTEISPVFLFDVAGISVRMRDLTAHFHAVVVLKIVAKGADAPAFNQNFFFNILGPWLSGRAHDLSFTLARACCGIGVPTPILDSVSQNAWRSSLDGLLMVPCLDSSIASSRGSRSVRFE